MLPGGWPECTKLAGKQPNSSTPEKPGFSGGLYGKERKMATYKKSKYTVEIPIDDNGDIRTCLYHTLTGAFSLMRKEDWSVLMDNPGVPTDHSTIEILCRQGILVAENEDEIALFKAWRNQYVYDFTTIKSKVLVTRKCNNRCLYCILDAEAKEMSRETARLMDEFYIDIIKKNNPSQVQDDFLGGEPLLNPNIILESAQRRFFFCEGKGIDYGFSITTNGTLVSKSIISEMKTVGLTGIRVSLAGPAHIHDCLRPSAKNEKTYTRIMENLESISGLTPIGIECQYDSGTLDFQCIPEMLDDFIQRKIEIENIAFTPILPRRGKNRFNSRLGNPGIFLYLKHEASKRGYPMNDQAPSNACMVDFHSIIIFDTDGSIIPCPSLQGSEMSYGHVTTGIDFAAESRLLRRSLPDKCLNKCELLPICFGGCRLQALIHQKDFSGIDCQYDAYRLFLEDYIREKAIAVLSS